MEQARAAHAVLMMDLPNHVSRWMQRIGLSPRETKATLDRIPKVIQAAIPKAILQELLDGKRPATGFGLGGNTGGGKTMALAAILRQAAVAQAKAYQPRRGSAFAGALTGTRWSSWPDEVAWLRSNAVDPKAAGRVDDLATCALLILDDLGRERIKGSYVEDWAASQLDTIVNHRYRHELPTLWTTNVTEADLVNLYGAALVRRLSADNPMTWIPNLRSLP